MALLIAIAYYCADMYLNNEPKLVARQWKIVHATHTPYIHWLSAKAPYKANKTQ